MRNLLPILVDHRTAPQHDAARAESLLACTCAHMLVCVCPGEASWVNFKYSMNGIIEKAHQAKTASIATAGRERTFRPAAQGPLRNS